MRLYKLISCPMLFVLLMSVLASADVSRPVAAQPGAIYSEADNSMGLQIAPAQRKDDFSTQSNVEWGVLDDWPMFRHDLSHTGYSASTAPDTNQTLWVYAAGDRVYSPAVVDGRVYVGSYDNSVYCLNAYIGTKIWKYTTGGQVWVSSPAVVDGRVYVGSYDNNVYCLNASDGTKIWSYATLSDVPCPPVVSDGRVYVGSYDYRVYCLNASSGTQIWNYRTGGVVQSSPAVADGKVYVGSSDNNVTCLNAYTGEYVWNYTTGGWVHSSPAVFNGRVYVGSWDGKVYCLDASTGTLKWNYQTGGSVYSSPAVAYGRVYVSSYDNNVYCLYASNGTKKWNYATLGDVLSSPAVAQDKVYVGSHDDNVYCLNAWDGTKIWSYKTGGDVYSSPAVSNGRVYVGSCDGKVYAFGSPLPLGSWPMFHHDLNHTGYSTSTAPITSQTLWSYSTGGDVYSSPAVSNGRVFVGSDDHNLTCMDAYTGDRLWNYTTGGIVWASPIVIDDRVYVSSYDNNVYCLNAYIGTKIWNYTTGGLVYSSPTVADGMVYVGSWDGRVYCLNASKGTQVWNYLTGGVVHSSPAVVDGRVYVGSYDSRVYCLNASKGTQIWNYTTSGPVHSSPAVSNGKVYVASWGGRVYCLNASKGTQIWNYTTSGVMKSSPAVAYGRVYVGSYDGRVYCLDASSGTQIWNFTTGGVVHSSPAVADGKVYVGSHDDNVYCLDAWDGTKIWSHKTGGDVYSSPAVADGIIYVGSCDGKVYAFGSLLQVKTNKMFYLPYNSWKKGETKVAITVKNISPYGIHFPRSEKVIIKNAYGVEIWPPRVLPSAIKGSYLEPLECDTILWDQKAFGWAIGILCIQAPCGRYTVVTDSELPEQNEAAAEFIIRDIGYCIIVVGSIQGLVGQECFDQGCDTVFGDLVGLGYDPGRIQYLNRYGDHWGIDALATLASFEDAVMNWAGNNRVNSTEPLFIYMFDHGGYNSFCMYDDPYPAWLGAEVLNGWLNTLEANTGASVYVIYNACHSGSFIDNLSKSGRVIVTTCEENEAGSRSASPYWEYFAQSFWPNVASGKDLMHAFNSAVKQNGQVIGRQYHPLLDDNGDGIGSRGKLSSSLGDGSLAQYVYIGDAEWVFPWTSYVVPKRYYSWSPPENVQLWAKVENKTPLSHVRALMLPPDWIPPPPDTEVVETPFEYFEMADPDHDGNWTVNIPSVNFTNHATGPSNFEFMITAEEENGETAIPLWTSVEFTETGLPSPDNMSPSVDIMRPLSDQIAQGIVTINGTATDDVCLQKVEVYADDSLLGVVSLPLASNAFFAADFNTTTFSNGPLTIEVKAFDTSNKTSTQTMMITVANPLHNIAVTNIASSKTVVGQGCVLTTNAIAENQDDHTQTFNVTAYANTTAIQTKTITLTNKNSTTITFTWNTTDIAKGDYTISAYAWPVPDETDTADNMLSDGWVFVSIPGDINADKKVDLKDVFAVGKAFGSTRGSDGLYWHSPAKSCCPHSPNCDIDDDGKIEFKDYYTTCKNYRKSW